MPKKYLSVTFVLICSVLVQIDSAKLENKNHSRHKRTVLSTISNWWYGEQTTPAPIEDLSFRDDLNVVNYSYYNPSGLGVYSQAAPPHSEDDLGRLARELGIRHIRNLPKIEEVMGLLGTNTKDETIRAIREFAATPGGVDMIESFLAPESEEEKDEYRPVNNVKQETVSVPVNSIIPHETVGTLPNQLRMGVHQPKAMSPQQSEEQKYDQTLDRFSTDLELAQKVPHESPGFFGRLGYYANFLNPFSLSRDPEELLPTKEAPVATVRPVVYRYPEGYNPYTKTNSDTKHRIELLEDEYKKLSGGSKVAESGPFVRYPQEIQPLVQTHQAPPSYNSIVNAPIPAYVYQSNPGHPYFANQHRLAAPSYPYPGLPQSGPPQRVPLVIDLANEEYSPNQVQALSNQQKINGQYVAVPLPPVINAPGVTSYNGDTGSYNLDVRFQEPIRVVDHIASGSEVHEEVVEPEPVEETKVSSTSEKSIDNKDTETLKSIPDHTTETSSVTSTTTEKAMEVAEESVVHVVTVLPDNDVSYEIPKENDENKENDE